MLGSSSPRITVISSPPHCIDALQASNKALEDERQRTTALLGRQMNLIQILMERGVPGACGVCGSAGGPHDSAGGSGGRRRHLQGDTPHSARGAYLALAVGPGVSSVIPLRHAARSDGVWMHGRRPSPRSFPHCCCTHLAMHRENRGPAPRSGRWLGVCCDVGGGGRAGAARAAGARWVWDNCVVRAGGCSRLQKHNAHCRLSATSLAQSRHCAPRITTRRVWQGLPGPLARDAGGHQDHPAARTHERRREAGAHGEPRTPPSSWHGAAPSLQWLPATNRGEHNGVYALLTRVPTVNDLRRPSWRRPSPAPWRTRTSSR